MSRIYRVVTSPMDDLPAITEEDLVLPSDFPVGGITSLQMEKALLENQEGLYKHNYTYLCLTNGTYHKDHFYRFNISGDQFSWVDLGAFRNALANLSYSELEFPITPEQPTITDDTLTVQDVPDADSYTVNAINTDTGDEYELGTISADELGGE